MTTENRTQANKALDDKAEQLAQRHQRRLKQMTETALEAASTQRPSGLSPQPALVFAALGIAVLTWWVMPTPENEITAPTPQMAAIPAWVLDEQVPMELLASPEFYRWLAKQNPMDETDEARQQG